MNPIAAVVTPVILTAIFGMSNVLVYKLLEFATISRVLSSIAIALVGAFCLDIAISIIVGNF